MKKPLLALSLVLFLLALFLPTIEGCKGCDAYRVDHKSDAADMAPVPPYSQPAPADLACFEPSPETKICAPNEAAPSTPDASVPDLTEPQIGPTVMNGAVTIDTAYVYPGHTNGPYTFLGVPKGKYSMDGTPLKQPVEISSRQGCYLHDGPKLSEVGVTGRIATGSKVGLLVVYDIFGYLWGKVDTKNVKILPAKPNNS